MINYFEKLKKALKSPENKPTPKRDGLIGQWIPKTINRTRKDLENWKMALKKADSVVNPRRKDLYDLYADVMLDALLTSQIEQRISRTVSSEFTIKDVNGTINEDATKTLTDAIWMPLLMRYMIESIFYGHSLVELGFNANGNLKVELIPRQNVIPEKGFFLFDSTGDEGIAYRDMREYGTYILEFGNPRNYGLLNKAVPHALFKKFADSCWSELCEIYGIPPRYIKTNTQDPEMLNRAEQMLRDMGSAAYFIIDTTEEFQFAKGADTNGDVYKNLIALCNSEMSMLISGAQIGQDTLNGNRSKEEVSVQQLEKFVNNDKHLVTNYMNGTVLPALTRLGIVPANMMFSFNSEEDTGELWSRTAQAMQYYEIDPAWIKNRFGIEVTQKKNSENGFFG